MIALPEPWSLAAHGAVTQAPYVPMPWWVNATVLDVHDGDTFRAFLIYNRVGHRELSEGPWAIRLVGCNARELAQPGGPDAGDHLRSLLPPGTPVVALVVGDDRDGGRLDAIVTYARSDGSTGDLVTDLIAGQWAAPWDGHGTKPVPPWPRTVTP